MLAIWHVPQKYKGNLLVCFCGNSALHCYIMWMWFILFLNNFSEGVNSTNQIYFLEHMFGLFMELHFIN